MRYGSWDIRHNGKSFLSFWTIFCPLTLKNQNFEKMKKEKLGDITIIYFCTKNDDHMMHGSRHGVRQTGFFVILEHFLPFYLTHNLKNQNFEIMKKTPGDITILHLCTTNGNHMMYHSWDMEHDRQSFLSFGLFLALLPP